MNTFGATLLWVEILLSLLLLMAAVFAWTARWSSGLGRVAVRAIITLACLTPVLAFLGLSLVLKTEQIVHNALMFSLPLATGYCIGGIVLGRINRVRVAQWPVMRLWIASLVAMSLTIMTLWNLDTNSQIRMQVARADAAALAVSIAPPMVPDDQNAAVVYNAVAELLKDGKIKNACDALDNLNDLEMRPGVSSLGRPQRSDALNKLNDSEMPLEIAKVADYVDELQGIIIRIEEAASRPYCRFDHPYSHPSFAMLLPELSSFRRIANLLYYSARVEAYRSRPERALRRISLIYRMQEHSSNSPCFVSGLVAIGIGGIADDAVLRVLPAVTDAQQLSSLHLPSDASLPRMMDRALISEEACSALAWIEIIENPEIAARYMSPVYDRKTHMLALPAAMLARLYSWPYEMDAFHENIQLNRKLSNTPVYQWKETRQELAERNQLNARQGPLTYVLLPYLTRGAEMTSAAIASRQMVQMVLAATRYRLERGHYPATAAELVPTYLPAIPIDPFDGKPLRMKTEADGLLFYSVGIDRIDDGGLEEPVFGKANHDDVMHLKTPEAFRRPPTTQPIQGGE